MVRAVAFEPPPGLLNDAIPDNPEYWVSRVEASHHDPGTAYVAFTGYRRDDFRPFVYRTTDFGATWTSIAANLPPGPVNVIREHDENADFLVVGTEFGVFVSVDGGGSWTAMKNEMPTNPVHDLQIHPREDDLIVATHGRGIYIADVSALAQVTSEVLASDAWFFEPEDRVRWQEADFTNYASSNFAGESEPEAVSLYYWLGEPASGDVTFTVYQGNVPIAEIDGRSGAGMHEVLWRMDKRRERSAEEQEEMRERFERFDRTPPEDQLRFVSEPASPGDYRVVMSIDGEERMAHQVSILRDLWWRDRR